MLSLSQLVTPIDQPTALQSLIKTLDDAGYQASSWQSGAIQLTVINLIAMIWSAVSTTISQISTGGFTSLSTIAYAWLALIANYWYDLTPIDESPTIGTMLLTSNASAGTTTFAAGDIVVADQPNGGSGANVYTNTSGGTLGPSSTLQLTFEATSAGVDGNIAPATMLYIWTSGLVGIAITNPVLAGSNTWVTTPGLDQESVQRLAARCLGKWSSLTYGNTDGAYLFWALQALPTLTRAQVLSAAGDGTVTLVGANSLGPISGGDITTIQNYIQGISDGVGRRPINDIFTAVAATTVTTPVLSVTAYCLPANVATIPAQVTQALLNYFGSIPLGGTKLSGSTGAVLYSDMMGLPTLATGKSIYDGVVGLKSLVFAGLSADIPLLPGQIYTPAITVSTITVNPGT